MIIMNLNINNFYNFKNFNMNFSYPRKIENSTIENEFLEGFPNFRYKKVVLLMGSNATGKTCLGRTISNAFQFLNEGNENLIFKMINNKKENASIILEIVNENNKLEEIHINYNNLTLEIEIFESLILEKDSYETAHNKLKLVYKGKYSNEINELIGKLNFQFAYPEIEKSLKTNFKDEKLFLNILKSVIGTLDPSLKNVMISKDLKNSFIIKREDDEIIIQDGKLLNRELLSSGTIEGIDVALFLANMYSKEKYFYYCDEHFSYIHTEIEKRIFQIMLRNIKEKEQLIFTTHNEEMFELNLPKHTFALLKRNKDNAPEVVFVSSLLKRNTDSVKCAVQNDTFNTLPDLTLLDELEEKYEE